MDKIHDLFELEVLQVVEAFPSIYTKDNVVSLINVLRTKVLNEVADLKPTVGITEIQFQEFAEAVNRKFEDELNRGNIEVYDPSSAEFSINYDNRVELENLDILTDSITDDLHNILLDQFQNHFGELITDKSE
jgi:myo-inositol-1-phosphate synthase